MRFKAYRFDLVLRGVGLVRFPPTQQCEKFEWLVIYSGNFCLEREERLGSRRVDHTYPQIAE